jgi:outer membrane protein assembly factor BamE
MKRILSLLGLITLITSCSSLQFPGAYRIPIHQGNVISQDMVDKLKVGMTRQQVQYVLGTPLIRDSFNQGRWDYYYSMRDSKGETSNKHISVFFAGDILHKVTGDYGLAETK